jgi:uncharacterized membrane protein
MNKKIFLILFFGLLIRLIALDQSLWLDEAVTANVISNYSYSEIITQFSPTDFHPPLYYLLMKLWTNIFGNSEIALRFPSIIFSLMTGWMIYLIGEKLKALKEFKGLEGLGIWVAALFLFNPLIIYYSQEARPYMLVTMFVTLIIYFLLRIQNTFPESKFFLFFPGKLGFEFRIFLINLFIFLSFLTFYGSIFFIAVLYIWLLFKKHFRLLFMVLPGFVLAGILIYPLFIQQYANSQIALSSVANWDLVLGKANLKNLFLIPVKFSIGRISFEPKILYWIVAGVWSMFVFSLVILNSLKSSSTRLRIWLTADSRFRGNDKEGRGYDSEGPGMTQENILLWLFIGPIFLAFLASFFTPLLQYFRFLYLIPLLSLLLAMPKTARPTRSGNWHVWVVLVGFLVFSFIYLLNPTYHREDWKGLVKSFNSNIIYMIPSSSDPVKYYNKNIEVRSLNQVAELDLENEIIVVPYTAEIHGVTYAETLEKLGYGLGNEISYRELKVEYWELIN